MVCLGLEPGAAGWQVQTNPLSYGGTPSLLFCYSEDYPYKEVLDLMANRCLSDRTNAWTATDHTCYTIYSAGSGGFLNILPVYLDHILFPLLRDEDFLTEVHHITGEGEDSGVVYSEMQVPTYMFNANVFTMSQSPKQNFIQNLYFLSSLIW